VKSKFMDKFDLYLSLSSRKENFDKYGWARVCKCDGLLFNCLWSIAGVNVPIESARDKYLKWHRHPSFNCYSNKESGSEISRDMILGLLLWCIFKRRSDIIDDLILFGESCGWIMGKGDITRTYLTPSLRGTIFEAIYHFTDRKSLMRFCPKDWVWPIPMNIVTNQPGYRRHLQALHIFALSLLRLPTKREIKIMKHHCLNQPMNALHRAIYNFLTLSPQDDAIDLLMNTTYFPNDRLPTNREYRADYLFQHDQTSLNWSSDHFSQHEEHLAIEWLFAAKIVEMGFLWTKKQCLPD
jgi:hypothetical protein